MNNFKKLLVLVLVLLLSVVTSCKKDDDNNNNQQDTLKDVTFYDVKTSLYEGETITITHSEEEGVTSVWTSSNTDIATTNGNKITGVAVGEFKLTIVFSKGEASKTYEYNMSVLEADYTISYELDGGVQNSNNSNSYNVLNLPVALNAPTKEGYTFKGWYDNSGFEGEQLVRIEEGTTGNVTVYAKWEKDPVYRTITYSLNGGTNPEDAPTHYEEGVELALPVPTREGYNFLGWTLKIQGKDYIETLPATTTGNVKLYAKWEKIVVYSNINYVLNEGILEDAPETYEEGKGVTLPVPTKEGYKFLGWSLAEGSTDYITSIDAASKGEVTVYANWEESFEPVVGDPFTLSFELNGGSWSWTTAPVTAPASGIDAISNLPEIFMADFYTYLVENDLLDSGKVSTKLQVSNWQAFATPYGDPVAWYNATSTGGYSAADGYSELFFDSVNGYEAVGGFLGTSPYKEKYANLTKHMLQLTNARYTSLTSTSKSYKGACGFVLDGYFYGTQGLRSEAIFDGLRGTMPTPTVGYDGLTQTTNEYLVSNGVVGTELKLVAPFKEGHMFLGWYDNPEFTGEKLTSVKQGCTLYALWYDLNSAAPVHEINYVLNGGTNASGAPTTFTQFVGATLPKPSREGYTFVGWSTDAEGKNVITEIGGNVYADVTVYANWIEGEEKVYTITYVYEEGSVPTTPAGTYEEFIAAFWSDYYNFVKPSETLEKFKANALAQWQGGSLGSYKLFKLNGRNDFDDAYFINAKAHADNIRVWFDTFDEVVSNINGEQNAWEQEFVACKRLYEVLNGSATSYWTDARKTKVYNAYPVKSILPETYETGTEVTLIELVINDGRTFLGWYDANGNKVEKIPANSEGNIVLTAKWSEAIPVETFEVTNKVEKLLKLSQYQLTWTIGPDNATFKKLTFASSNPSVLTISENGLIEAVSVGTATISITVHGNTALNVEFEIEVYVDPYIDGQFVEESYVVAGEQIHLGATVVGSTSNKVVWTSKTPNIATVDDTGVVTGVSSGLAEIVVTLADNENISFVFYVTVFDTAPTGILKLLVDSNNSEIYTKDHLLIGIKIGSDGAYYSDIVGSVSKLLFEDYAVYDDFYLADPSNKSTLNGDGIGGIDFITVHYAADMPYSSSAMFNGGRNLASYNKSCNTNGTQASWHYSVGNDGIWACQTESFGAWHAGASKKMTWTDSGVTTAQIGTDVYPTDVKLGSDGYFYIKGVKTTVKNTTSSTKLNGMGLGVKLVGNTWYLGGHYFNSSYQYISSTGGNNNSIGMETSVREGSDLWLTWQYTAQLCAKLLLKYKLPLNRLVGHHFFSGKWCPQPMLENDLEIWYEFVELTRQQMDLYENYSDYSLSFASDSSYLKDNGRVKELPNYPQCVTYTVTYQVGTTTKTVTLSSILPGNLE